MRRETLLNSLSLSLSLYIYIYRERDRETLELLSRGKMRAAEKSSAAAMAAQVLASVEQSFGKVPPAAIPAMLDCVIASSGVAPASLLLPLIHAFPVLPPPQASEGARGELGSDRCIYLSCFVAAICHLLKKPGGTANSVELFVCKCYIPLVKTIHGVDAELINQCFSKTAELLVDVLIETNTWCVVEEILVKLFLRSLGPSMGTLHDKSTIYRWSNSEVDEESLNERIPVQLSCYILTSILDASLKCWKVVEGSSEWLLLTHLHDSAKTFSGNLLWELCNMTIKMLSESMELRSCALGSILPCILKTFAVGGSFEVSINGKKHLFPRGQFVRDLWFCCKTLFSRGPLERRAAYSVLSLYLSFFPYSAGNGDAQVSSEAGNFDFRSENEFWNEIREGLVDDESIIRKECLHILKTALQMNERSECYTKVSEKVLHSKCPTPNGMTKREFWADKEARSLGVKSFTNNLNEKLSGEQRWEAFLLLYEMLEEYGSHLVDAAWNHQMTMLLHISSPHDDLLKTTGNEKFQDKMESYSDFYKWLGILWQRGLCHENPQVRCLVMESFLGIEWKSMTSYAHLVPESFVLGPLVTGLNDPAQHKDFGVALNYSSRTIQGAAKFFQQYAGLLSMRSRIEFVRNLASITKRQLFGRAGLMGLVKCIASAACGIEAHVEFEGKLCKDIMSAAREENSVSEGLHRDTKVDLIDVLRFVMESGKQHFNPKYRVEVCENIMATAASLVCASDIPLVVLLNFISAFPPEIIEHDGTLRVKVKEWLLGYTKKHENGEPCTTMCLLTSLHEFLDSFIKSQHSVNTYDDEELYSWESEAKRWAKVFFLVMEDQKDLEPLLMLFQNCNLCIGQENKHFEWEPVKFLISILSVVQEVHLMQDRVTNCHSHKFEAAEMEREDQSSQVNSSNLIKMFGICFHSILENVVSFANASCSIFWLTTIPIDTTLPASVTGKLGGPSQRRLSSSMTAKVLNAITSIRTVAALSSWSAQFGSNVSLNASFTFLWRFFLKTISSASCDSETAAEVILAANEASAYVLKALVSASCLPAFGIVMESNRSLLPQETGRNLFDVVVLTFLQNLNNLLELRLLSRSRRAVLMNWKWLCLESLLSMTDYALKRVHLEDIYLISEASATCIFSEISESLEIAGEGCIVPMLKSIRLVLGIFASVRQQSIVSSCNGMDAQMMWKLVRASWELHSSCKKRRVASIAAVLSAVLHPSLFNDETMHGTDDAPGPLKWFVEKLLVEGSKSPRTIRLAALHLTGLWFLYPKTLRFYMKELKLLSLYGSVAFDEDFEGEVMDNHDARAEVSLLGKSPDPELTTAFINTEMYARVSVAVLFYKLVDMTNSVGPSSEIDKSLDVRAAGKLFLLVLLDSVVNDKDLAKELYKKYSAIHRRKVRAWQMLCVLSHFIDEYIVEKVLESLDICLSRNNLPAVRQYLETFAINLYLKFPFLVKAHLAPIFHDYNMKVQALSSYVFIAANIILHSPVGRQHRHLDELFPLLVPLLTSHHHSLRGFTQVLVFQVLCKLFPSTLPESMPLEKRCFRELKLYLGENIDCIRLRASMIGYLDAFDPKLAATPAGIFSNRTEALEFECVSTSLLEQITSFLNDAREDLRSSMAKDTASLKNESFMNVEDLRGRETLAGDIDKHFLSQQLLFDFQKKATIATHERNNRSSCSSGSNGTFNQLFDMEKEDQLIEQVLRMRSLTLEKIKADRQPVIIVASLLDRVPNIAGLARTCEVFKAAALAVADTNVFRDKQFQLISVTAEKWVPCLEVPVNSIELFLEKKKREGYSILGLEITANSVPIDRYIFPKKTVMVLGREKEGIPVNIIHRLDACVEIPMSGAIRSLNAHVSGAIALWEYTRQQRIC